jgi:hypothetical protein
MGNERAAMGILATGVESIFSEPPLSYRSTKSVNLLLLQRKPDISLHYTQHQRPKSLLPPLICEKRCRALGWLISQIFILSVKRKRQTNTGPAPPDFDAFTLAAQALGVSSATRFRAKSAKPGSTEAEVVTEQQAQAATSFDDRIDDRDSWSGVFTSDMYPISSAKSYGAHPVLGQVVAQFQFQIFQDSTENGIVLLFVHLLSKLQFQVFLYNF